MLAACAGVTDGPRVVTVSEAQLAQRIAEQFPLRQRYLELFDLTLSSPRVRLMPAENRLATRVDYALGDFWGGSRRMDGALTLSYGLRFEPSDNSVRMSDVKLQPQTLPQWLVHNAATRPNEVAQRHAPVRAPRQRARRCVGNIAQRLDRQVHRPPRLGADQRLAVDRA